ncbi:MAG: hypothetical protein Q8M88_00300 [Phenylobacterium sp.]|uniref:hypothetical protein n=1 Tax=Phenylobacterium sp. TaxID=1871053 RepID=UPI0027323247|nr:hypothetical protein [Phenylobacterium sp.]MDP3172859.1 hypothetical protein [Phenylobacterium sp.]
MPGLSAHKIAIVRNLVESSPDKVVGALQAALASTDLDSDLGGVRRLVEHEAQDRRLRNVVLQPVAALFVGDGRATGRLIFPTRALALIWRGLKQDAPNEMAIAVAAAVEMRADEPDPGVFDILAARAADGLRSREQRDFRAAAEVCDLARPGGANLLCSCLDLGPIGRAATRRLGEWISRTSDENTAAARLAYKDAVGVAEDAGPRFFEMLAGQLASPWMVLRIISAVMDRPHETYLAQSECAGFALRVMDDIDLGLVAIAELDVDGGPRAGLAAAKVVDDVTLRISELEQTIELTRAGPWGSRLAKQKQALAACVEDRLRAAEKAAGDALPTQGAKIARLFKQVPRLDIPLDPGAFTRAMTLLTFTHQIRSSANYGGFASARTKLCDKLGETIDHYVEEVLDRLREGEVEDPGLARARLEAAAEFSALIRDPKAAEIIRRRMLAACVEPHPEPEA